MNIIIPMSLKNNNKNHLEDDNNISSLLIACLMELPSPITALFLIEYKYLKRKYSIILTLVLLLINNILIVF